MDGSRQLGRWGRHDHSGKPSPQWWLIGVSRCWRSGPPSLTRFSHTASWWRGELDSLTFRRQRAVVAASDGEAARLALAVVASKLWCSSGEDEVTKGGSGLRRSFLDGWFGTGNDTLVRRRASHSGSGFDYCRSKFAIERTLYIGLFTMNRFKRSP
jgi:hypothetical protein